MTYDIENSYAINSFQQFLFDNCSVSITQDYDRSCYYDAIYYDENHNITAIVESKARPTYSYKYDHLLTDYSKIVHVIEEAVKLKCAAYLIHYFIKDQVIYYYKLVDSDGNINLKFNLSYELQRKNNYSQDRVLKIVARIPTEICVKFNPTTIDLGINYENSVS